jgi:orotate phosphoribosyltransferase
MGILKRTGAFREGIFEHPGGFFTESYFQMPIAMRYADNARVLSVALSRLLRRSRELISALPGVSIVAPGAGGVLVAFEVRQALRAEQIFWAERESGELRFRQYNEIQPKQKCVIVDDIARSGDTVRRVHEMITSAGGEVLAIGVVVRQTGADLNIPEVPVYALMDYEMQQYTSAQACPSWREGASVERVRF